MNATVVENAPTTVVYSSTEPAQPSHVTTVIQQTKTSNPPNGAPDGGMWGYVNYAGPETMAAACILHLLCLPGFLSLLWCPQDEKDVYMVNGEIYDSAGNILDVSCDKFFRQSKKHHRNTRRGGRHRRGARSSFGDSNHGFHHNGHGHNHGFHDSHGHNNDFHNDHNFGCDHSVPSWDGGASRRGDDNDDNDNEW